MAVKTSISFGLIFVPIELKNVIKNNDISFNQLDKKTHKRIKHKKFIENTDKEVETKDIVKAYEYAADKYVVFSDEDFDKIKTEKDNTISIEQFINLSEIDPIYYEKSYYAVPLAGADTAYALLLEAMKKYGKVGIARTVLNNKEHIIAIRAKDDALLLSTLFFYEEVQRNPVKLDLQRKLNDVEIEMAGKLIALMEKHFEPEKLRDAYQARLRAAIEQKIQGKEIIASPKQATQQVGDIMKALQQSIQQINKPIIPNNASRQYTIPQ